MCNKHVEAERRDENEKETLLLTFEVAMRCDVLRPRLLRDGCKGVGRKPIQEIRVKTCCVLIEAKELAKDRPRGQATFAGVVYGLRSAVVKQGSQVGSYAAASRKCEVGPADADMKKSHKIK